MKILFLSRFFYPRIGGVEKHVEQVSSQLINKGHQVTVLTLKHDKKLPDISKRGDIKIVRIPYSNSKWPIWRNIWQEKSLFREADIIHCHDVFFWYLPFRFLFINKPVFTTFHGWEGDFPIPKKNILVRKLSEKLSRGNICVGEYISKWYGTKPNFITYGAIEHTSSKKLKTKDLNECIFIGRLEKDMSINEFFKAFKEIKNKYNFKITFVGDGQYKNQAKKIGRVTGMVKNVKTYLKKPAFIFTSSYLVILEAMAVKCPVFILYHNQLKKDGFILHPATKLMNISASAGGLIKQFNHAIKHPQDIDKLVSKAYRFAKVQTWKKLAQTYLFLWQSKSSKLD